MRPVDRPRTVMVVFGTRPEAIKLAPVVLTLTKSDRFTPVVTVTAQHREMLDQVLELFKIVPKYDLDIQQSRQSLTDITLRALEGLEAVIGSVRPDLVMVQGDTTTAFTAALSAFYTGVPVAHLEAGLRTGDPRAPFPEEINRRLVTQLTSLHLAPTELNRDNLVAEGVDESNIVCTGNTVIDALNFAIGLREDYGTHLLGSLDADPRRVVLVTLHRRESWGRTMQGFGRVVARLADDPGLLVVFPLHLNPAVRDSILPAVSGRDNILVTDPLPYGGFARLIDRSDLVLTDSGGIQEEAPSRGKPVLVLRDKTERSEAVEAGTVELVGTDEHRVLARARSLLGNRAEYERMSRAVNPYGDGRAANRILGALSWYFGHGPRPEEFKP